MSKFMPYVNARQRGSLIKMAALMGMMDHDIIPESCITPEEKADLQQAVALIQNTLVSICRRQGADFVRTLKNDADATEMMSFTNFGKLDMHLHIDGEQIAADRKTMGDLLDLASVACLGCEGMDPMVCPIKRFNDMTDRAMVNRDSEYCGYRVAQEEMVMDSLDELQALVD